ncbi:hypothetical protein BCR44DRAFT_1426998, partial [Catenaria anguillulae PL171]
MSDSCLVAIAIGCLVACCRPSFSPIHCLLGVYCVCRAASVYTSVFIFLFA